LGGAQPAGFQAVDHGALFRVAADAGAVLCKHRLAVEIAGTHLVDVTEQLYRLLLQGRTVAVAKAAVARLDRELAQALQAVGDLGHRAVGHLQHRGGVADVAGCLAHPAQARRHPLGDGVAGRVVGRAVDAQPARQALDGARQHLRTRRGIALGTQRTYIGIDRQGHRGQSRSSSNCLTTRSKKT
jgi:hypothetical protein